MQRILAFLMLFSTALLAACAGAPDRPGSVKTPTVVQARPEIRPAPEVEVSSLNRVAPPAAASVASPLQPLAALPAASGNAHIALLLPLKSPFFGRAAEVVRQGFMAGASIQPGALPVTVYSSNDETDDIVSTYRQAMQAGASVVVGPLTRNGVSALAASSQVSVPTLALNLPEQNIVFPPKLYVFGLAADLEARQMARIAFGEDRKKAVAIASGNTLSKRIQQAFSDEWSALGGSAGNLFFNGLNSTDVRDELSRQAPDVLFLAMDSRDARLLRPFLNNDLPTYATSQIYAGSSSLQKYHDLNGVQFIDMPWLLQPDHLAVMVYPRPEPTVPADMERLYALGIDAWRLALQLQMASPGFTFSLDGVTGQLMLDVRSHQINREGVRAEFSDGEAILLVP
ncbi:MAG: penicillin-binding protein activator [Pseudomonadota bacterium]|jgi:outer membrane PBP1 activator LpoA protein|nr:penicillin-binding protein activator [Gammaproteobacteria bacterium]MBU1733177.1 penicillin-binding protein activator [Gammaproteobacteria bacterium]MBU1892225.1 penicillin-binding protein activator [Gammaproteobacteria bacterium]